jgi:hypothetical protein
MIANVAGAGWGAPQSNAAAVMWRHDLNREGFNFSGSCIFI